MQPCEGYLVEILTTIMSHCYTPRSRQFLVQSATSRSTVCLDITSTTMNEPTVGDLKRVIGSSMGIVSEEQLLTCAGRMIHGHDDAMVLSRIISEDIDMPKVIVNQRVRGGKMVKVKMMTQHLDCGSEVTIDIAENASKDEIKMKLSEKTGVPFEHIKVMLSGINQIVMGDKRTNIGYSTCGYANSVQLAVEKAE